MFIIDWLNIFHISLVGRFEKNMFTRNSILLVIILMAMFIIGACSSGGGSQQKKPTDQKTQNAAGDQAATTGQQPTEGASGETPAPASALAGSTTTTNEGMTVTQEDGTTKVYDAQGNLVEGSGTSTSTPGETKTDASGTAQPSSQEDTIKKEIKTRGDVNINNKVAIIKTNFGDVYVFFYPEIAPTHVRNFIYLAEKGFYKDVKFHRIVKEFMAQAGIARPDWTEPVPAMPLEARSNSNALHFPGALSAARTNDPNSATSQFFLVFTRERAKHLDGQYTVFGQAFRGLDVVKKLENIRCEPNPDRTTEISKPVQDVHIVDVVIEDAAKYQQEISKVVADNAKILEKERGGQVKPAG